MSIRTCTSTDNVGYLEAGFLVIAIRRLGRVTLYAPHVGVEPTTGNPALFARSEAIY